jgi:hypothetical protein
MRRSLAACAGSAILLAGCGGDPPASEPETSSVPAAAPSTEPVAPAPSTTSSSATTVEWGFAEVELSPIGAGAPAASAHLSSTPLGTTLIVVEAADAEGFVPDIHPGSCLTLGSGPSYYLPPVQGGRAENTVAAPIERLLDGAHAIHLHAESGEPVACGEIPSG